MKKLIAILLVCMLLASAASAAEWTEGLGPHKPYSGVPELDLTQTIGYIMMYPRTKMPAKYFCDALQIYLPREDLALNEGTLTLYTEDNEVVGTYDFADGDHVKLRLLDDWELDNLMWGGGMCVMVQLDRSLEMGKKYYVFMDEGCFTAANGTIPSLFIGNPDAWTPVVEGDFGVSGLYYSDPPVEPDPSQMEIPSDAEGAEADAAEAPGQEAEPITYKLHPELGDIITFDLVMGGDATTAVIFSENDSVRFDMQQYETSQTVTGVVTDTDLNWGIVFLNGADVVGLVQLANGNAEEEAPAEEAPAEEASAEEAPAEEAPAEAQEAEGAN